jgi:hypothetical protein
MKTAKLLIEVSYDEKATDAEALASALDRLLETALSTPGILDEHGNPKVSSFHAQAEEPAGGHLLQDEFQAVVLTEQDGRDLFLHGVVLLRRDVNLRVAAEAIQRIRLQVIADNHRATGGEEDWTYDDILDALRREGYPCVHFLAVEEGEALGIPRSTQEKAACECQLCGKRWPRNLLQPVTDITQRCGPDDDPEGDCPACGGLCYDVGQEE